MIFLFEITAVQRYPNYFEQCTEAPKAGHLNSSAANGIRKNASNNKICIVSRGTWSDVNDFSVGGCVRDTQG